MTIKTHGIGYDWPEALRRLGGISSPTGYELVRNGKLKVSKLGRRTIVTDKQIADCFAACEVEEVQR